MKQYLGIRCHEIKSCNVKPESPCLGKLANTCSKTHKVLSGNIGRLPHDLFTGNQIMMYIKTFTRLLYWAGMDQRDWFIAPLIKQCTVLYGLLQR